MFKTFQTACPCLQAAQARSGLFFCSLLCGSTSKHCSPLAIVNASFDTQQTQCRHLCRFGGQQHAKCRGVRCGGPSSAVWPRRSPAGKGVAAWDPEGCIWRVKSAERGPLHRSGGGRSHRPQQSVFLWLGLGASRDLHYEICSRLPLLWSHYS